MESNYTYAVIISGEAFASQTSANPSCRLLLCLSKRWRCAISSRQAIKVSRLCHEGDITCIIISEFSSKLTQIFARTIIWITAKGKSVVTTEFNGTLESRAGHLTLNESVWSPVEWSQGRMLLWNPKRFAVIKLTLAKLNILLSGLINIG